MLSDSLNSSAGEQLRNPVFFKIKFVSDVERHAGRRQFCQQFAGFAGQPKLDSYAFLFEFRNKQSPVFVTDLQSRSEANPLLRLRTVK